MTEPAVEPAAEVEGWTDPKEVAREAVAYALLEDGAKGRKEAARTWMVNYLIAEDSRGVDAYAADGTLIGSITRSKPKEVTDVLDSEAFMAYVVEHRPDLLSVEYQARMSLLRSFTEVDGVFVDPNGIPVPGVGRRMTHGSIRVNKEAAAKALVAQLLAGVDSVLDGLQAIEPPAPEPLDRYTTDRQAGGVE